jgi:hypothetical protein
VSWRDFYGALRDPAKVYFLSAPDWDMADKFWREILAEVECRT